VNKLPEGWIEGTFADISDIKLGKMLDKSKNVGLLSSYIRNINVRWGKFDLEDILEMRATPDDRSSLSIRDGDLMVCEGGEPGRSAVWNGGETDLIYQKALMRVRVERLINPYYLAFFLKKSTVDGSISAYLTGTTIKHLPQSALRQMKIPIPPAEEQNRIVEKINRLRARSEGARTELECVHQLVTAYKRASLDAAYTGTLRGVRASTPLPWTNVEVGSIIVAIHAGKNLRCEERPPGVGERGVVKVSAVTWGTFDPSQSKTLPPDYIPLERDRIAPGDFLFSRANTLELVGACVLVEHAPDNLYLSDKILRLEMDEDIKPWLLWFLRSTEGRRQLENMSSGNQLSMRNISQEGLRGVRIPMPSRKERDEIIQCIETSFAAIDRLAAEAHSARDALDKLNQVVLTKSFRGELIPQDPNDEPASVLIDRIKVERAAAGPALKRGRRPRTTAGA